MQFHHSTAEIYVPDGRPVPAALKRVTHLGIGAHQDDLEFMAFHGILACHTSPSRWFGGVTCTNGAGSARAGRFRHFSDAQMMAVRRREQNRAARLGRYGAMIQLDYPSRTVKGATDNALMRDLMVILATTRARVVYTHNPADKHDTHVGVVIAAIQAMRALPPAQRPRQVIGCEVWRSLDWLPDDQKVLLDVSGHDRLAAKLNRVFASQIAGGKRYDLATLGRRSANATFFDAHATDAASQLIFGMDLTPLVTEPNRDISGYVLNLIDDFRADVVAKLNGRLGRG